jgi:hypothetical protein
MYRVLVEKPVAKEAICSTRRRWEETAEERCAVMGPSTHAPQNDIAVSSALKTIHNGEEIHTSCYSEYFSSQNAWRILITFRIKAIPVTGLGGL